jgi:hypothetical protein
VVSPTQSGSVRQPVQFKRGAGASAFCDLSRGFFLTKRIPGPGRRPVRAFQAVLFNPKAHPMCASKEGFCHDHHNQL